MKLQLPEYHTSLTALESLPREVPVNVVLGGGGEKGVAHVALLQKLEALELNIAGISAVSSGALVGAMYASGQTPEDIYAFFRDTTLFRYSWINPARRGIFDSARYAEYLDERVAERFDELDFPLYLCSTNMESGEPEYFHAGEIMQPLIASCAVPAIFHPAHIDGQTYCDGGIMDNFPIHPFEGASEPVIGSYVAAPGKRTPKQLNSLIKITQHAAALRGFAVNREKFFKTAWTAIFPVEEYGFFDQRQVVDIYRAACAFLEVPPITFVED